MHSDQLSVVSCQLSAGEKETCVKDFMELKVWQKSHSLAVAVYQITSYCGEPHLYPPLAMQGEGRGGVFRLCAEGYL